MIWLYALLLPSVMPAVDFQEVVDAVVNAGHDGRVFIVAPAERARNVTGCNPSHGRRQVKRFRSSGRHDWRKRLKRARGR